MRITFLGTGSSMSTPKKEGKPFRSYTGFYVETGHDFLLFDIGPGAVTKLLESGIDTLHKPTHVFITHYHLDHCLDLIALAKHRGLFYTGSGKKYPVHVFGPDGLSSVAKHLFSDLPQWDYMDKELGAFEVLQMKETMKGQVAEGTGWRVTCSPVKHYNGVAYKLEMNGKSLVYSGDMGYDENLAVLGKNAEIAVVECSYPDKKSLQGLHLCPEDIGKLATLGNFKHTILTHMYPACEGREDEMKRTIESLANTKVAIAHDFLSIEV